MNKLTSLWNRAAAFFEDGDLTPIAVVISIAHYGPVLARHGDNVVIAWLVGALIDLLHYRTVRRLFQVTGRPAVIGHALIAVVTTAMAMGYHLRFYGGDWLLAAPIPVGIAILAQHAAAQRQEAEQEAQAETKEAQALTSRLQAETERLQERIKELQEQGKSQQEIIKAWQTMNKETQALVRYNAKLVTAEQVADIIGVKDVRTVQSRAEKLNGFAK